MNELQSILRTHNSKLKKDETGPAKPSIEATFAEIPDLFFDEILVKFKLSRQEVLVLMSLYRLVWCKPNLYAKYGLSPMISYVELSRTLDISTEEVVTAIKTLNSYQFINTIRAGQFFVHKYFTKEHDEFYGQSYDEF